jgi:CBS domain-containing protein
MKADDLMCRNVYTCSERDSLEQAAQIMWECDVGCLVVIDHEIHPIGIITDRDIAMAAYTQGARLAETSVSTAMARQIRSCGPSTPLGDIETAMQSAQIRRMPVVDQTGKLVGIVTLGDLARAAQSSPLRMAAIPGVTKTLAAVTERRMPKAAE